VRKSHDRTRIYSLSLPPSLTYTQPLCHREVIAINQDSLGTQGRLIDSTVYTDRFSDEPEADATSNMVFARPLNDLSVAVALLNTGHFAGPHNITVNFQKVSTCMQLKYQLLLKDVVQSMCTIMTKIQALTLLLFRIIIHKFCSVLALHRCIN
jgi:hypothetical protein